MGGPNTSSASSAFRPGSFRDPSGRTFVGDDRVLREVAPLAWPDLAAFLNTPLAQRLDQERRIVSTRVVSRTERHITLEHEKIPFPSYPFEWAPEMLKAAGSLTLDLAEQLCAHGFGLKDATPYNVLFRGPVPVFVDVLSFERRSPGDPIWLPYGQFVRTFLLPLLLDRRFAVPLKGTFLAHRDGIEPESVYVVAGALKRFIPPILTLATIPTLLARATSSKPSRYRQRQVSVEAGQFALGRLYRTTRKQLEQVSRARSQESTWSGYERTCPYSSAQRVQKRDFVESILRQRRPRRLLDIGCNTGTFSYLAGRLGAAIVAIDSDPAVIDAVWQKARSDKLNILPLVVDIARPSPAGGWRNLEHESFLSRCKGQFECVLMLGMIHHLLVTERIPLEAILDLAADLSSDALIIEYIGPDDPMFQSLLRGRENLHGGFSQHTFERACESRFHIVEKCSLVECGRVLYFLRKRTTA